MSNAPQFHARRSPDAALLTCGPHRAYTCNKVAHLAFSRTRAVSRLPRSRALPPPTVRLTLCARAGPYTYSETLSVAPCRSATMMPHLSMMPHLWTSVWRSASWYLEPWSGASPKWGALAKSLAREKTEGRFASCRAAGPRRVRLPAGSASALLRLDHPHFLRVLPAARGTWPSSTAPRAPRRSSHTSACAIATETRGDPRTARGVAWFRFGFRFGFDNHVRDGR